MERVNLGDSKIKVCRLGIGTWAIGGFGWSNVNDQDSIAALRQAWGKGINFFDTADVYGQGHAEEILAKALGDDRHKAIIATKFGVRIGPDGKTFKDISPKYVLSALEASLRRLRLETIPLYQIHWPDGVTPIEETMAILEACKKQGKIGHIGYSNFSPELVVRAERAGRGISLQAPYSLIHREVENELLPFCRRQKISLIAYGPLAQGLLSGKFSTNQKFDESDIRRRYPEWQGSDFEKNLAIAKKLGEIGAAYGKTAAQTAIRWVLDKNQNGAVLAGVTSPGQVLENLGALDWQLSTEDIDLLSNI